MTYAVDTSIIIHLLRGTPLVVSQYDKNTQDFEKFASLQIFGLD